MVIEDIETRALPASDEASVAAWLAQHMDEPPTPAQVQQARAAIMREKGRRKRAREARKAAPQPRRKPLKQSTRPKARSAAHVVSELMADMLAWVPFLSGQKAPQAVPALAVPKPISKLQKAPAACQEASAPVSDAVAHIPERTS